MSKWQNITAALLASAVVICGPVSAQAETPVTKIRFTLDMTHYPLATDFAG